MVYRISRAAIDTIETRSARAHPLEACGLLVGAPGWIKRAAETANVAPTPDTHFEIDPTALFAALRAERGGGERLLGYWHSHPRGPARPSATDIDCAAADGRVWLILGQGVARLWRPRQEPGGHIRFEPVDLVVEP